MQNIIVRLVLNALALLVITAIVPGFYVANIYTALVVAIFIGLVNAFVKPLLLVFTFPITILTMGVFVVVINIVLFWFVSTFIKGFVIHSFSAAIVGWLLYTMFGTLTNYLLKQ